MVQVCGRLTRFIQIYAKYTFCQLWKMIHGIQLLLIKVFIDTMLILFPYSITHQIERFRNQTGIISFLLIYSLSILLLIVDFLFK